MSFINFILRGAEVLYENVGNIREVEVDFAEEQLPVFTECTYTLKNNSVCKHDRSNNLFFSASFPQLDNVRKAFSIIISSLTWIRNGSVLHTNTTEAALC